MDRIPWIPLPSAAADVVQEALVALIVGDVGIIAPVSVPRPESSTPSCSP